jgi:ADP-ribosylglycohydrolase
MLIGLIHLSFAGLLFRGEPEKAYVKAFEMDFYDVGYARDATGMMAAMVSAALSGRIGAREMVRVGLETNPFGYGDPMFGGRIMADRVRAFLELASEAEDDQALVQALAREVAHLHPYDPIDVLGVSMAAVYASEGDAVRSITMAANDRYLDEQGDLRQLRDVDCTASVAGALVGALRGVDAFREDWVEAVMTANKALYGIDIEANARAFCEAAYSTG